MNHLRRDDIASAMRTSLARSALAAGALVSALGAVDPSPAYAASSWRCGNRLVHGGDHQAEVHRRCGEPDFRTPSTEVISFETPSGLVVSKVVAVDIWTYNRGPREFIRYLKFRDGRLVEIIEGGYGY